MNKIFFLLLFPAFANAQLITTVAGNGTAGFGGDGAAATSAQLNSVYGMAVDDTGNLYIADYLNNRIRRVRASDGIIETVAGNGASGYSGDGGAAVSAQLDHPTGVALNSSGTILYISDDFNSAIRKVDLYTGIISTIGGTPTVWGISGDGGPATNAKLNRPTSIWTDGTGNVYFTDGAACTVRKIDVITGIISRFAGTGAMACHMGNEGPAVAAGLMTPQAGCRDWHGNTYLVESYVSSARKIDNGTNIIHRLTGNCSSGFTGDGGPATAGQLSNPYGIASDPWGNVYIADGGNERIRIIDTNGLMNSASGSPPLWSYADGVLLSAAHVIPVSLCFDKFGNLYIGESAKVRKVSGVFEPPLPGSLAVDKVVYASQDVVPNPTNGKITIRNARRGAEVCVYNMVGKKIFEIPALGEEGIIDISGNPPGIYFLWVRNAEVVTANKIILE